jgi:hypothetical protein
LILVNDGEAAAGRRSPGDLIWRNAVAGFRGASFDHVSPCPQSLAHATEEAMDAGGSLMDRFRAVKASVRRYFDDAAIRRELREELQGLGGGDLDRVLADLGLNKDEMDLVIENAPRSRMLLQSMLRRLNLDRRLTLMAPQLVRNIERRCATCVNQRECNDWMDRGAPGDGYRKFCPNAETFDALPRAGRMV